MFPKLQTSWDRRGRGEESQPYGVKNIRESCSQFWRHGQYYRPIFTDQIKPISSSV